MCAPEPTTLSTHSSSHAALTPLNSGSYRLPLPGSGSTRPSYESRILLRYTHEPKQADVAQQVEQLTRNEQVSGSSPLVGSLVFSLFKLSTQRKASYNALQ
jgi:hypothetical protein